MAKNIKEEILAQAQELFNKSSYNDVSMRDIADAVGISVGNLTYHFNKKEDIIFEIVEEQHKHYKRRAAATTLIEFDDMFKKMEFRQQKRAHYFRHFTQLAQTYPEIAKLQLSIMMDIFETTRESLIILEQKGYLKKPTLDWQLDAIVHSIITISTFGMQHLERTRKQGLEYSQRKSIWSLLYFQLTPQGIESFIKDIEPTLD